jgi:DNA-binding IclR family transcriptional regulator
MTSSEPYPGTQAVLRALTLLKSFTDEQPQLSLIELAEGAGLNKTTAFRLLTALESEGLVTHNSLTNTYWLGPEVIVLGGRAMRANNLRAVSRPELEMLAHQTQETATLEVLSQGQVLILDEAMGSYLVGMTHSIGSHWPLHATSTGKAMLAHLPQVQRDSLLHFPLASFTPNTITTADKLYQELADVREQGYAIGDEELEIGFMVVGAPVFNHNSEIVGAISVGGPSARLRDKISEIAELVRQSAGRISEQLGYK